MYRLARLPLPARRLFGCLDDRLRRCLDGCLDGVFGGSFVVVAICSCILHGAHDRLGTCDRIDHAVHHRQAQHVPERCTSSLKVAIGSGLGGKLLGQQHGKLPLQAFTQPWVVYIFIECIRIAGPRSRTHPVER